MLKQCQSPNITQYYGSQARILVAITTTRHRALRAAKCRGCSLLTVPHCIPAMWVRQDEVAVLPVPYGAAFPRAARSCTPLPAPPFLQAVPGTSQLMIVMELMAASAADLVSRFALPWQTCWAFVGSIRQRFAPSPSLAVHASVLTSQPFLAYVRRGFPRVSAPALQVSEETGGEPLPESCIAYVMRQVRRRRSAMRRSASSSAPPLPVVCFSLSTLKCATSTREVTSWAGAASAGLPARRTSHPSRRQGRQHPPGRGRRGQGVRFWRQRAAQVRSGGLTGSSQARRACSGASTGPARHRCPLGSQPAAAARWASSGAHS